MRRLPPWLWLLMALIFGATATFMSLRWMKSQSRQVAQKAPKVLTAPVVVTAKDVDAAQSIKAGQLSVVQWPQKTVPKGGFGSVEEVVGRVTVLPLGAGEPILEPKLAPQGTPAGMVALVGDQKRAMTVKVNESSGVAGFIIPNNRVDVLVSLNRGEYSSDPLARIVLENLRVLGTGQKIIENNPDGKAHVVPTVTLEVTPEEGERLALASTEGHISLVLRGQKDKILVATSGVRTSQLFRSGPDAGIVQIIRGKKAENAISLQSVASKTATTGKM